MSDELRTRSSGADCGDDAVERVREFLRMKDYPVDIILSRETIFTVEDASKAVGAPAEHILKSLVLLADDAPILALMSGVNKVDVKKVRRAVGAKKVRMASPEYVFQWSGFKIGGVPPVGYPEEIPALMDEDLFLYSTVWAAAGTDHAFFPVSPADLAGLTGGQKQDIKSGK